MLSMVEVELTLQVQLDEDSEKWVKDSDLNERMEFASVSKQQWQQWFEQWLSYLDPKLSALDAYEVSLLLATDAEIQCLNSTYRHQDSPTDVLAFAALEWEGPVSSAQQQYPVHLGDIVISVETARQQALKQSHPLDIELAWLACHGLLHLLGWDHPDVTQLDQMLTEQSKLLTLIGLETPAWTADCFGYPD
jgi:probable rRNA maturation factor